MADRGPETPQTGGDERYSVWFVALAVLFVACLIAANVIAVKPIGAFGLVLPAAVIIFPLSYIIGDVITEVYGLRAARRVIWLGFMANLLVVAAIGAGQLLPGASFWDGQAAYESILGAVPRIVAASLAAYLVGEFANAYVLARMKRATNGRWLWTRTIGSTVVGQGLDSLVFITAAFAGVWPPGQMAAAVVTQWLFKVAYEAVATPGTYLAVGFLERREGRGRLDRGVGFTPQSL